MDLQLAGKRALVTGSSRGIGRAIAQALAAEGARVAVNGRTQETVAAVVETLPGAVAVLGDVADPAGAAAVVADAAAALGGLDIVVNNVGGSGARTFADCDDADLDAALSRNLWPAFRVSRAAIPHLRAAGGGAIVLIASIWGREGGGAPGYNVAKAAEISLSKAMARDLAVDNIRVNSVAPGSIFFPGGGWERRQKADPDGIADFVRRELPFGRFGRPEEVGSVVAFVCSPRASWIAGTCLVVDGGQSRMF